MFFWNFTLLLLGSGLLCFVNDSQPRFLAGILIITATLGIALHGFDLSMTSWLMGYIVYILLNLVAAALSPLQCFIQRSKPRSKPKQGILIHYPKGEAKEDISVE